MRYLGLDLGTKTLGIALSDTTHTISSPYTILRMEDKDYPSLLEPLKEIVDKEVVDKIILGFPKNMNNSITERGEETLMFKDMLEKFLNKDVYLQDERLSTVAAHNYMLEADMSRKKRKKKIDSLAASIILQTYLDKERGI